MTDETMSDDRLYREYAPPEVVLLNEEGAAIPTPGRIVWYQTDERGGKSYYLPAIVSVTQDNLVLAGVEAGDIEGLDTPMHVHLNVQSPGVPYVEQNVAYDPNGSPRSWRWPDRV